MIRPRVVVRAFHGQPLVRWVWAVDRRTVYVVDDDNLARLESGIFELPPVGFPLEDVFEFTSETEIAVSRWETLKPWDPRTFVASGGVMEFTRNDMRARRSDRPAGGEVA